MDPREQWRVDQAEAHRREFDRKAGRVITVMIWMLLGYAIAVGALAVTGRI